MSRVRAAVGAVLLLVGLVALALWHLLQPQESLPYAADAAPPAPAQVTRDVTYSLAVPGGVNALSARGVQIAASSTQLSLQCSWTLGDSSAEPLALTAENMDTKATNTVAHFQAPVTGAIRVSCTGWGPVYIPDADNRSTDWAGAMVLLSTVTLTVGVGLLLSAGYAASQRRVRTDGDRRVRDTDAASIV